jgi:hypothetical protein
MEQGRATPQPAALDFVRRMHALGGGASLRRQAVAHALRALPPEEAARLVGDVLALARAGDEAADCVLGALMAALEDARLARGVTEALALLSPEAVGREVAALLASGPAWRTLDEDAAARSDARNFTETLGHLKTKARTARDPDALARMALVSNPSVVRNLLLNPRLTEPMVVRLAARRPARGEPLVEVFRSRWGHRHAVRRALVFNPYLPPEVGVKLVPLLLRTDWEEIAQDGALHPSVRAEARGLLAAPVEELPRPTETSALELDPPED